MKEYPTATALICLDDRCHDPAKRFAKERLDVLKVDCITAPGVVGLFAKADFKRLAYVKEDVLLSARAHNSKGLLAIGHEGCAGNPVSDEMHREHVRQTCEEACQWLKEEDIRIPVIGLFVNEREEVEVVCELTF